MSEETMKEEMEFIPVSLASKILNVSTIIVYTLVRRGDLPAYRFGSTWRINRQELMDYIQKSKHQKEE